MHSNTSLMRVTCKYFIHGSCSTHHCLHHFHPPCPHFTDKIKDADVLILLQSLHHCIKSDESATATHTSTRDRGTHKNYQFHIGPPELVAVKYTYNYYVE